ncbi:MAG TPA: peptidoglycan-associated lipoprotein Pal [Geobacteraceae bacterium]|nr:peptidoglycan-associated lipoprotein Pal [Geobacteraceae bacterium]
MKRVFNRPALFVCLVLLSAAGCAKNDMVKKDEMVPQAAVTRQTESTPSKPAQPDGSLEDRQAKETPVPTEDQLKSTMDSIYFNFDAADLDSTARDSLAATYRFLQSKPGVKVRIEGNCDERGSSEYNLALGEKRAKVARKYLTAMGIAGDRLSTISYGKEKPADPSHNEDAWKKNRRDDFVVVSK